MSLVQALFLGTLLSLTGISTVSAQSSGATCTLGSLRWAFNSRQQSPCEVASSLIAVCTGTYHVEPLEPSSHYIGPTIDTANECQCSSVTYSMMSACGACQNRTIASWSEWTGSCPKVSHRTFLRPLPETVRVPGWAYFDVKEHDTFDIALARQNPNATESTFIAPPPSSTSSSIQPSATVAVSEETPESVQTRENRLQNIIGQSVVGGVLFIFLLIFALLTFRHYRQRRQASTPHNADQGGVESFASQKSDTESQMEERSVPVLLIHPPTTAELNAIAVGGSVTSSASDGSLSPTSARGRGYDINESTGR